MNEENTNCLNCQMNSNGTAYSSTKDVNKLRLYHGDELVGALDGFNPENKVPKNLLKIKKEDEYHIDEIVHNLEALDFNSREARENVNQVLQTLRNTVKTQVLKILTEEINIAHSEGEKTSRLTSAFNKVSKL